VCPSPNPRQNDSSNRQAYAWPFPHRTAMRLALNASSLPTSRTRTMPCSIARASFTRIRNNVSVNRPLRTLSTHRIVRSNNPLSTRSSTLYQTRFLRARVFNPASFRPVRGESRISCTFDSSFNDLGISLSLYDLPQIVQDLLFPRSFSLPSSQYPTSQQSCRYSHQCSVEQPLRRPEMSG